MTGSPIVIDCSIVLRWLLPDPLSEACWRLFKRVVEAENQINAPSLLAYEVVSGLTKAVHLKNISPETGRRCLAHFFTLECELAEAEAELSQRAFDWTIQLGRLASYDSYYLALAEVLNCDLWTADRRLANVSQLAKINWVHWIEEI